jgi:integrase
MRRFCIFKRTGQKVYYSQIKNPQTGKFLPAKSTGQTEESEALLVVADWIKNGIPNGSTQKRKELTGAFALDTILNTISSNELTRMDAERIIELLNRKGLVESAIMTSDGADNQLLIPFLENFWNYAESPYVREKLAYGHSIGQRHCYEQTHRLIHWRDYFGTETRLRDISRKKLQQFQLTLNEKKLAPKTINNILTVGTVAFTWAQNNGILQADPGFGLRKFSGKSEKRGILTPAETEKLFRVPWPDERGRLASMVAATTGLRAGEIAALRVADVQNDRLLVRHSWSNHDLLKKPKNGEARIVPILPDLSTALLNLANQNPHGATSNAFVFWSITMDDRPVETQHFNNTFREALLYLSLSSEDMLSPQKVVLAREKWRSRGIVFHSWRHYFSTLMANRLDARKIQIVTGHKSGTMFQHYADHETQEAFDEVSKAGEETFGEMIRVVG